MKKIILITLTVFLNFALTSCSVNDDEINPQDFETVATTGGDDEGEILPPPPPPPTNP
jgi:hypothetical protein